MMTLARIAATIDRFASTVATNSRTPMTFGATTVLVATTSDRFALNLGTHSRGPMTFDATTLRAATTDRFALAPRHELAEAA